MNARRRMHFGRDRNERTAPTAYAALCDLYESCPSRRGLGPRIDMTQKMPKWIEAREYHPNVEKYYWNTCLRPVWIRTKRINLIKFVEYVKLPRNEEFKP